MSSLKLLAAVERLKKILPLAAVLIGALSMLITWGLEKSVLTALIATGIGIVLALLSGWTLTLVARNSSLQLLAVGADYLIKIVILISSVLIVQNVSGLDRRVMGLILVANILVQAALQVRILMQVKGPVVEPNLRVHDVNKETDSQ
ncbi:hypothetical protein NXS08_01120 [Gleimia sp. 6138-11-ORH1]|uniref:hypothetical protein n=1 Tax=Gleimia sp. 6138-11-ORH1 TaxID=2973937 RepID=UPI002169F838|nr:hypothetical protein [Gleimia sp. 6138-11-ORH1]MCS4484093.1 hypothetical protein [Gleimia sp. 6138-11-ORH1]